MARAKKETTLATVEIPVVGTESVAEYNVTEPYKHCTSFLIGTMEIKIKKGKLMLTDVLAAALRIKGFIE